MATSPIKIHKQSSFNDLFINEDYIGFSGSTYFIYDPTFSQEFNFLTTEITLLNNAIKKYQNYIQDYHFYSECFLIDTPYTDIKQELEQIKEISKRCFTENITEILKYRVSNRGFKIELRAKNTYFGFFRKNENPMYRERNKEILFEAQQGITRFQKDYEFSIEDEAIFDELLMHIIKNEK
jgi:hypothetical protein